MTGIDPLKVFPARAGMSRPAGALTLPMGSFPRPRGDEPRPQRDQELRRRFSPPARG